MRSHRPIGACLVGVLGLISVSGVAFAQDEPAGVAVPTFSRDVAPILYENCTSCHRPREAAPMSLLTFREARPWARAIRERVADGSMPPWHADASPGTFANERGLTAEQRDTLARWADGGALEGNPRDLPAAPVYRDGWGIGEPDTYAVGTNPQVLPEGTAIRLEPGGVIELQMHYTPNGEAATDRTKVGLIFSDVPDPREVRASAFVNGVFTIPAGARDVQVDADVAFTQDVTLWALFPHTHLRGTRWEYHLERPDGTRERILSVPAYNFDWQTYYFFEHPLEIPAGSRIVSSAWYDNSPTNRSNPDPSVDVHWGDQTWNEMQYSGLLFSQTARGE